MTRGRTMVEAPTAERARLAAGFVTVLAGLGLGGVVSSFLSTGSEIDDHWVSALLVLALMVQGHALRIRFRYRKHSEDLNFFEATLAVAFVGFTPGDAAALAAVATAGVLLVQGVPALKCAFNIAQWMVSALIGGIVYTQLATGSPSSRILAVLAALVAVEIVNQSALAVILYLVTGHPAGVAVNGGVWRILEGRLLSAVASLSMGLLLAAAYSWTPWTILCAFAPLGLLHWAGKGYATVQTDHARLDGLQRVTHALAVSLDLRSAIERFIDEVRESFEVRGVELLLSHNGTWVTFACGEFSDSVGDAERRARLLGVVHQVTATMRVRAGKTDNDELDEYVRARGARDCILAPLGGDGRLGVLSMLDRVGMEGFEEGEVAVATALAAELVGFLERANLVDQLIEERSKLAQIVDQTSDGILTISTDGTIRTWNAALENLTGYHAQEMIGTTHLGLLRAQDETGGDIWLDKWAKLAKLPERLQIRTAAGVTRWLSCSFTRTADDGEGHDVAEPTLIVVARDVTAAHELERLKDDFVAVVSHELRTPLVPIKGWASMLLSRGDRMTSEQRRDALESIQAQAQRLERLILNILDASRIEGGLDASGGPVDVSAVAARVVDEMLPTCATHVVRLHGADRPVRAFGQPVWIERALANLLANAVKYAPVTSAVDIRLSIEDAEVLVSVTDEGPGIPPSWQDRIFERFERIPDSDTQTGTGLGLYITRQLVTAMGGRVEVESTVGQGTTFTVRLRSATVDVPTPRPADPSAADTEAPTGVRTTAN